MDNKKVAMIAFSVLALFVAVGVIYWTYKSQQIDVVKTVDGGTGTAAKLQGLKAQKDAAGKGDRDPNSIGDK